MSAKQGLPVVDNQGRLCGLISQRDLLFNALSKALGIGPEVMAHALAAVKVAECMTANPTSVSSDTSLAEAAKLMLANKYGCLPVVDGDKLVGILTESDFVAAFAS